MNDGDQDDTSTGRVTLMYKHYGERRDGNGLLSQKPLGNSDLYEMDRDDLHAVRHLASKQTFGLFA